MTTKKAPAAEMDASGAIIEKDAKDVEFKHPAVDSNPRANSTEEMNQIDFNDPTKTQKEAVADNLKK